VIGPGAGICCYEVGDEVHEVLGGKNREGSRVDLKAIAREQLLRGGVDEVHDLGLCTICDPRFFSHRREGSQAGRQVGVAWLS
jgi:copper oxidase (laccase) domain-containing protein